MKLKIKMYTDGSCKDNKVGQGIGGYGSIIFFLGEKHEINGCFENTTNNRMELIAVIKSFEHLNKLLRDYNFKNAAATLIKKDIFIDLYSDSTYLVDAFNKHWIESWQKKNWKVKGGNLRSNYDLWIELLAIIEGYKINFIWIKGHAGNKENNRCDEIAYEAMINKHKKSLDLIKNNYNSQQMNFFDASKSV
jgi:ribonuclease HI